MPVHSLPLASTQIVSTQLRRAVCDCNSASCPPAITNKEYIEQFKEKYERSNMSRLNSRIIVERRPHYTHHNKMQEHDNANNVHTFDKNVVNVNNELEVNPLNPMLLKKIKVHTSSNDNIHDDNNNNNLDKVKVTHNIPNAECELMSKSEEFKNGLPIYVRESVECATNSAHSPHWIPATTLESFSASEQSEVKERSVLSNSVNSTSGHVTKIHSDGSELSSTRSSSQTHVFSINRQPLSPNNAISAVTDKIENNTVANNKHNVNTIASLKISDKSKENFLTEIKESEYKWENMEDNHKHSRNHGAEWMCKKEQAVTAKDIENLLHTEQEYISQISSTNNQHKPPCHHTQLQPEQKKSKKHFITLAIPSLAHDCISLAPRPLSQPVHETPQTSCTQDVDTRNNIYIEGFHNKSSDTNLETQQEEKHLQWYNAHLNHEKQKQNEEHEQQEQQHERLEISLKRYLPEEGSLPLETSESYYQRDVQEHLECEELINSLAESTSSSEGVKEEWDYVGKRLASSITDNTYCKKKLSNSASICDYNNSYNAQSKSGNLTVKSDCTASKCNNNSFSFLDKSIVNLSRKSWPPHASNAKFASSTSKFTASHTHSPEKMECMLIEEHERQQPLKESGRQLEHTELPSKECNCPYEHYKKEEEEREVFEYEELEEQQKQQQQRRRYYCKNTNQRMEKLEEPQPDLEEEEHQTILSEVPLLVHTNGSGFYSNTNSSTLYSNSTTSNVVVGGTNTNAHNELKHSRMFDIVPQNVPLPLHDDTPTHSVFSFTPEESEEQRQQIFEKSLHTPLERQDQYLQVELEVEKNTQKGNTEEEEEEHPKEVVIEPEFQLTRLKDNPRTSSSTSTNNQPSLMDRHNSVFSEFASILTPLTNDSALPRSHFSNKTEPHYTIGTMRNDELFSWAQKSTPIANSSLGTSLMEDTHLELENMKRAIRMQTELPQIECEPEITVERHDDDDNGIFTEANTTNITSGDNNKKETSNQESIHNACNNDFTEAKIIPEINIDGTGEIVVKDNHSTESNMDANNAKKDANHNLSVDKSEENIVNDKLADNNTDTVNKEIIQEVTNSTDVPVQSKSPKLTVEVLEQCQESVKLQSPEKVEECKPENQVKIEEKRQESSQRLFENNNNINNTMDGSEERAIGINPTPQEFWKAMSIPSPINNEGDDYDEVMSTNRKFSTYEDIGNDKYRLLNDDQDEHQNEDISDMEEDEYVSTTREEGEEDARLVCEEDKEVLLCEKLKADEEEEEHDDEIIHDDKDDDSNNNNNIKENEIVVINDICVDSDNTNRRSMNESNLTNHHRYSNSIHKLIADEESQEEREVATELQDYSQMTSFEETYTECKLPTNLKRHRGHVLRIVFSLCHGILSLIGIIGIILTYLYTDWYKHWFFILNCDDTIDVHPTNAYVCNGLMELPAILFVVSFWLVYLYRRCPQRQSKMHSRRLREVTERLIGKHPHRRRTLGQSLDMVGLNQKTSITTTIRNKWKAAKDKLINNFNIMTQNSASEERSSQHASQMGNSNGIRSTSIIHHSMKPTSQTNTTTFLSRLEESERLEQPIIEAEEVYTSTSNSIKDNPLHRLTAMKSEQIKNIANNNNHKNNNNNNQISDNCNNVFVEPHFLTVEDEIQVPATTNRKKVVCLNNNNTSNISNNNKIKPLHTSTINTNNTTSNGSSVAQVSLSTESTNTIVSSSEASFLTNSSRGVEQRESKKLSLRTRIGDRNVILIKPHEESQPALPQRQWREERESEEECQIVNSNEGMSTLEQNVKVCESSNHVTIPVTMSSHVQSNDENNNNKSINNIEIKPPIFDGHAHSLRKVSNYNNNNNDDGQQQQEQLTQNTQEVEVAEKGSIFTSVLEWLEKVHCGRYVCNFLRYLYFTLVLFIIVAVVVLSFNLFMAFSLMEPHRALWITNTTINDYDFCRDVQVFGKCSGWTSLCTANFTSQEDAHNHNCPYCPWWQETIQTYETTCYTRYINLRKFNMIFFGAIVLLGGMCMLIILLGQSITLCLNYWY